MLKQPRNFSNKHTIKFAAIFGIFLITACSTGPSSQEAESAFLAYIKTQSSEDAKLTQFTLQGCSQSNEGYNCSIKSNVVALGGNFDQGYNGQFLFSKQNGQYKILQRLTVE